MLRHTLSAVALVAVILTSSCGTSSTPDVQQVGSAGEAACSRARAKDVVLRFVDAFNAGDLDRLDELFPRKNGPPPAFQWFSATEGDIRRGGRNLVVWDRDDLL